MRFVLACLLMGAWVNPWCGDLIASQDARKGPPVQIIADFLARAGLQPVGQIAKPQAPIELESAQQDFARLTPDLCCHTRTPIRIGSQPYKKGLGAHANGRAVFRLNRPCKSFFAEVGIDNNSDTQGMRGSAVFSVKVDGKEMARTPICRGGEEPRRIEVALTNAQRLELSVSDAGDGIGYDQSDWADARVIDELGGTQFLSDLVSSAAQYPFLQQQRLPASFVYDGLSSTKLLAGWPRQENPVQEKEDRRLHEVTWREPGGGLVATWQVAVFKTAPAMEFHWTFLNSGTNRSRVLSRVLALDLEANVGRNRTRLVHSTGGLTGGLRDAELGFAVSETPLGSARLSAAGGRSSNRDLPFFVIHDDGSATGVYVGIGWSGQWQADLACANPESRLRVTAEMPGLNLALEPGERIPTPSVLLGAYRGDTRTGCNALRRLLYERYVPLLNGKKPLPPVSWNSWFVLNNTINEDLLKREADVAADLGFEYFCIDAGWFIGDFPDGVGNWTLNKTKFPHGLRPIGNYVASLGMHLGLWFEPERVAANTRLAREHPEWVHNDLLDLGNRAARDWVLAMMQQFIEEGRVGWIRFDFNTDPLRTWEQRDGPETKGIAQIRHVEGLYALLDQLRARFPDLLIEGCASGGRRIDLETIKRSHTFWKSDETGSLPVMRFHQTGGNVFLPGVLLNANLLSVRDRFDVDSLFGGPLGFGADLTKLTADQKNLVRRRVADYKQVRSLMDFDYYPLFPLQRDLSGWVGWQFHDPEQGEGFLVFLRPEGSPYDSAQVALYAIHGPGKYALTEPGSSRTVTVTGHDLVQGWTVKLLRGGASQVLHYKAVD